VPKDILNNYECVCFHETDLPFGRGGSPLQNLISRGYKETFVTALRMTEEIDAGAVYLKKPLSLNGLAEEIYMRAAEIIYSMIKVIVLEEPEPIPQKGKVTVFERRTPQMSQFQTSFSTLSKLFDHIRMLDASEYPRAFVEYGNYRIEFSRPALRTDKIEATATITLKTGKGKDD
jgi:methionyl-tRNA formyltransferase